jgi:hypothetical protein
MPRRPKRHQIRSHILQHHIEFNEKCLSIRRHLWIRDVSWDAAMLAPSMLPIQSPFPGRSADYISYNMALHPHPCLKCASSRCTCPLSLFFHRHSCLSSSIFSSCFFNKPHTLNHSFGLSRHCLIRIWPYQSMVAPSPMMFSHPLWPLPSCSQWGVPSRPARMALARLHQWHRPC